MDPGRAFGCESFGYDGSNVRREGGKQERERERERERVQGCRTSPHPFGRRGDMATKCTGAFPTIQEAAMNLVRGISRHIPEESRGQPGEQML